MAEETRQYDPDSSVGQVPQAQFVIDTARSALSP